MRIEDAKKIIKYVVKETEPIWQQYDEHWDKIDEIFIRRGYEQGGFEAWKFAALLKQHDIFSIDKIGQILDNYQGNDKKYNRNFAGSLISEFYKDMENGKYGEVGKRFYLCVKNFKGKRGAWFWRLLWQMLVCCNDLKNNYNSSFGYFLKKEYAEFKKVREIKDFEFFQISYDEWEEFKRSKKPWGKLYGIGENVFDFIIGDIVEAKFAKDSYKLDAANKHFFKVTGIVKLIDKIDDREKVISFLKKLNLPYTLREINKGIYTYCSETEAKKFGFCRNKNKCNECEVNDVCEKNL